MHREERGAGTSPRRPLKQVRPNTKSGGRRQRRMPVSPCRAQSARFPPRAKSPRLSFPAYSAKVQWEAAHGEPCPYVHGCPTPPIQRKRRRSPAAPTHKSSQHGASLPTAVPAVQQQYCGFGSGFHNYPYALTEKQCSSYHDCGREGNGHVCGDGRADAVRADFSPTTGGTSPGGQTRVIGGKNPRDRDGVDNGSGRRRRRAVPTLLELHQRVIDAALREISQSHEKPFENLGERLGGEHNSFTYCTYDGHSLCGDTRAEALIRGPARLPEVFPPKQRASTVARKNRILTRSRNQPRTSTLPLSRTQAADAPHMSMALPRCNEPWKIPLLRTSWTHNHCGSSSGEYFYDTTDIFHATELPDSCEDMHASAAATKQVQGVDEAAFGPTTQSSDATEQRNDKVPEVHDTYGDATPPAAAATRLCAGAPQYVGGIVSSSRHVPLADDEHNLGEDDAGLLSGVPGPYASASLAVARHFVEEVLSSSLEAPPTTNFNTPSPARANDLSELASLPESSKAGTSACFAAVKHFVDDTVSSAWRITSAGNEQTSAASGAESLFGSAVARAPMPLATVNQCIEAVSTSLQVPQATKLANARTSAECDAGLLSGAPVPGAPVSLAFPRQFVAKTNSSARRESYADKTQNSAESDAGSPPGAPEPDFSISRAVAKYFIDETTLSSLRAMPADLANVQTHTECDADVMPRVPALDGSASFDVAKQYPKEIVTNDQRAPTAAALGHAHTPTEGDAGLGFGPILPGFSVVLAVAKRFVEETVSRSLRATPTVDLADVRSAAEYDAGVLRGATIPDGSSFATAKQCLQATIPNARRAPPGADLGDEEAPKSDASSSSGALAPGFSASLAAAQQFFDEIVLNTRRLPPDEEFSDARNHAQCGAGLLPGAPGPCRSASHTAARQFVDINVSSPLRVPAAAALGDAQTNATGHPGLPSGAPAPGSSATLAAATQYVEETASSSRRVAPAADLEDFISTAEGDARAPGQHVATPLALARQYVRESISSVLQTHAARDLASLPGSSETGLSVSLAEAKQNVGGTVSSARRLPPAGNAQTHAESGAELLSRAPLPDAAVPFTVARQYCEKNVSSLPQDRSLVDLNSKLTSKHARAESELDSLSGASGPGLQAPLVAVERHVEVIVSQASRGVLLAASGEGSRIMKSTGRTHSDGKTRREQSEVATEPAIIAHKCSEQYMRQGLQARIARTLGDGNSGSRRGAGDNTERACPTGISFQPHNDVSTRSTKRCVFETEVNSPDDSEANTPRSGTTTPMSSDSSSIEFILKDDESSTGTNLGSSKARNLCEIDATELDSSVSIARVEAITAAATKVVGEWVLEIFGTSARPITPPTPAEVEVFSASTSAHAERFLANELAASYSQLHPSAPRGVATKVLPQGLLKDIVLRRTSLKPVETSRQTSASSAERERLSKLGTHRQEERCADREAADRAEALRELKALVRTEALDRYDAGAFSRGAVYGDGRHSVVYAAHAAGPCGEGRYTSGGGRDAGGAVATTEHTKQAVAATVAKEASGEVMTSAVVARVTTRASSVGMPAEFAAALIESVISRSISAVAATALGSIETTTTVLAAKEFRYTRVDTPVSVLRQAHREVSMHLRMSGCARVVALRGVWLSPRVTILLEPMDGGSLHRFVRARAAEELARRGVTAAAECLGYNKRRLQAHFETTSLVAEAAAGLAALHNAGIVHRDVKSHNVMVGRRKPVTKIETTDTVLDGNGAGDFNSLWEAKLGDLGSAVLVPLEGQAALTEEAGTSGWVAPEVFGGQGYGTPADVFSLGILIWDAFVRGALANPLCGLSREACKLKEGLRPPWPRPPLATAPKSIERLAERCWALDPAGRPTADAVAAELVTFAAEVAQQTKAGADLTEGVNESA